MKKTIISLSILTFFISQIILGQTFTTVEVSLPGSSIFPVNWIDYDKDGDLDLFVIANNNDILLKNTSGSFQPQGLSVPKYPVGQFAWEDYDNDGDIDLIITSELINESSDDGESGVRLYENKGNGQFQYRRLPISYFISRGSAWCDFDNDGDLDFFYFGAWPNAYSNAACIWRNDGNDVFTQVASFGSMDIVSFDIGDFNNDGWKDIIITGYGFPTTILKNNGKMSFTQISTSIQSISDGNILFADLNEDGYPDVVVCGSLNSKIYNNLGGSGSFTDVGASITGTRYGKASCGDYDNDGKLDLLITGSNSQDSMITSLYHNEGSFIFSDATVNFPTATVRYCAWGDYDNDGDLDIVASGTTGSSNVVILRNDCTNVNTKPSAPSFLHAVAAGDSITFSWNSGSDLQTASSGLTYELRVGRLPGSNDLLSCLSNTITGQREVARPGNALASKTITLFGVPNGTYYWSVQSIDNCYAGSLFANEQLVTVTTSNIQSYTAIHPGITGFAYGASVWGDYDGDGDLDILVTGSTEGSIYTYQKITRIYRNDNGTFTDIHANFLGLNFSAAAWGDYDNDGDLDIAVSGMAMDGSIVAIIYRNDGNGVFTNIQAPLLGLMRGAIAWGDYNCDGLLDLVICGESSYGSSGRVCIYRNLGNDHFKALPQSTYSSEGSTVAWGDYDNDGDLDLAIGCGSRSGTRLLRCDGNDVFTDINVEFSEEKSWKQGGPVVWCDYDMDGDLDLLAERTIYKNSNGIFSIGIVLDMPEVGIHSTWVGDLNNDGYPDILTTGVVNGTSQYILRCYLNDKSANFRNTILNINPTVLGTISAGDFDHDGDLDILLSGILETGPSTCEVYKRTGLSNSAPSNPVSLSSVIQNGKVHLAWSPGSDAETPQNGLTYNIRIGSSLALQDFCSAQANSNSGWRYLPEMGNTQVKLWSDYNSDISGTYYWSVQTIDQGYAGSLFSDVQTFHFNAIPRFSIDTLNFEEVLEGQEKSITFSIYNGGNISLIIRSLTIPDSSFTLTPTADTLKIGDSILVTITFRPNYGVSHNTQLTVFHNGLPGMSTIPVKALMKEIPILQCAKTYSIGRVLLNSSKDSLITFKNIGHDTLIMNNVSLNDSHFSIRSMPIQILPGQFIRDTIQFIPTSLGEILTTAIISSNSISSPDTMILKGIGYGIPWLAFSVSQLSFGKVPIGSSKDTIVSINNSGNDTLKIYAIQSSHSAFNVHCDNIPLAPGQTRFDTLRFAPSTKDSISSLIIYQSNSTKLADTIKISGIGDTTITGVTTSNVNPFRYKLYQNYPNPFNPSTTITFEIPKDGQVTIRIYNLLGQEVSLLWDKQLSQGEHTVIWNAEGFPSGVYYYRLHYGSITETKKLLYIR